MYIFRFLWIAAVDLSYGAALNDLRKTPFFRVTRVFPDFSLIKGGVPDVPCHTLIGMDRDGDPGRVGDKDPFFICCFS